MSKLPFDSSLPINHLASIFNDRSTSYKFLLFKSILESVNEGKQVLKFDELALRSLSYASYSINYYKLNFGHSDQIGTWVRKITSSLDVQRKPSEEIFKYFLQSLDDEEIKNFIKEFKRFVPYRLLSPWFKNELIGKNDSEKNNLIKVHSLDESKKSLYQISIINGEMSLIIPEDWANYLKINYAFIFGWWKSEFLLYLQKNNPTVLSLATKLELPIERDMKDVKNLFKDYYSSSNKVPVCFYSGVELESISHDHFLPWSFMGSDPIYNFVPALKKVNSKKSDSIPHEKYLPILGIFQFDIFDFVRKHKQSSNIFESYISDLKLEVAVSEEDFINKLNLFYNPLFLSSYNQGFAQGWEYNSFDE